MVCAEQQCTNHANPSLRSGTGVKGQANVSRTRLRARKINKNSIFTASCNMCILFIYDTHYGGVKMRTNIVIDDSLMNKAKKISGYKTKKETIEEALRLLVAQREQSEIRKVRGKLNWEGSLEEMRLDR